MSADPTMIRPANRRELYRLFLKGGVGAEIGVQRGDNAAVLIEETEPIAVSLVDAWQHRNTGTDYDQDRANAEQSKHDANFAHVRQRFMSGATAVRLTSEQFWKLSAGGYDWIYIDADHTYEAVIADLRGASRCVKPGGIIAGHDYCDSSQTTQFGVIQAVDKFTSETDWRMVALTRGAFPSYMLQREGA